MLLICVGRCVSCYSIMTDQHAHTHFTPHVTVRTSTCACLDLVAFPFSQYVLTARYILQAPTHSATLISDQVKSCWIIMRSRGSPNRAASLRLLALSQKRKKKKQCFISSEKSARSNGNTTPAHPQVQAHSCCVYCILQHALQL